MAYGRIAKLPRRAVASVGGPEAEKFLNDLVSNDISTIRPGGAGYGGLLTPQGKILFDFLVFREAEHFLFDIAKTAIDDFVKRLGFYKLRARVEIANMSTTHCIAAAWGGDKPPLVDGVVAPDPRLAELGYRMIVPVDDPISTTDHEVVDEASYDAHRITLGIPEGGVDFFYGEVFPHDTDMDQLGGVAFDKGCFVGQEVVSRMEHRGTARKRIAHASAAVPLPPAGTEVTAGGRLVGTIASAANRTGLAAIRLDRVKEAVDSSIPLLAGDIPVEIEIPKWARFKFPDAVTQD